MSILLGMAVELASSLVAMLLAAATLYVIVRAQRQAGAAGRWPAGPATLLWQLLKPSARSGPRPRTERLEDGVRQLKVELEDLNDEINDQLESQMAALGKLLRDADARIAELRRLLDREPVTVSSATPEPSHEAVSAAVGHERSQAMGLSRSAASLPSSLRRDGAQESKPNRPSSVPGDRQALVYKLAAQGLDAGQIAVETRIPNGEVRLMLELRRDQPAGSDVNTPATRQPA